MFALGLPPNFPLRQPYGVAASSAAAAAYILRRKHLLFLHHYSFEGLYCFFGYGIRDFCCQGLLKRKRYTFVGLLPGIFSGTFSTCLCFFSGNESGKDLGGKGKSRFETSSEKPSQRRPWTNALLAVNAIAFAAHIASEGKLMLWGAKINSLIDEGQLWRLITSSFLHANIVHLLVNCYSLNSVGPAVESISGPKRFLAVYFTSAVASSTMSYCFCRTPAVGASGAVFGLVGSFAVFVLRHQRLFKGSKEDLKQIAQVIVLNMAIGLLSKHIDNWGHLGGLLGGAVVSWFLGPAWRYEYLLGEKKAVLVDRAPISYLINQGRRKH